MMDDIREASIVMTGMYMLEEAVRNQPSVQPNVPDMNVGDMVSRSYLLSEYDRQHKGEAGEARKIIEEAPSAEPEPLTDKEQRIFLAAMGREEKVCKEVDDECRTCREPYEDSLVRTCHEIIRKVKGALWT